MDIRQLRFFVEVVQKGSFTKAARRFRIAQPAISVSIRKLEEEVGFTLLTRQRNNVTLTAEGETLYRHAEQILEKCAAAEAEMADLSGVEKGEVRIGAPPEIVDYFFPQVIVPFLEHYPNIELAVYDEETANIHKMISAGDIDLGVTTGHSVTKDLEYKPFQSEEIVACVPSDHYMAEYGTVSLSDFCKEPLVVFSKGNYLRVLLDEIVKTIGLQPIVVFETKSYTLAQSLIKDRVGLSILMRNAIKEDRGLTAISFDPPLHVDFVIAWKAGRYISQANRAFIDCLLGLN